MGLDTDQMKQHGQQSEKGYSCLQIALGAVMLGIGIQYLPTETGAGDTEGSEDNILVEGGPAPKERDPCPNGAAYYLYVAGIALLVTNLVGLCSKCCQYLAERDGKISGGEACGLGLLSCASGILVIVDLVMLIWGSVVVFGAWSTWTDDYSVYVKEPNHYNYCANQPMMTAFIILILKWVLIPCFIILTCCCTCLCALCCGCCGLGAATASQNV